MPANAGQSSGIEAWSADTGEHVSYSFARTRPEYQSSTTGELKDKGHRPPDGPVLCEAPTLYSNRLEDRSFESNGPNG